jgi:hypothetical protein
MLSALVSTGAEFGRLPDPFTGNWSGTRMVNGEKQEFYATMINYGNHYEVSLRKTPNPRISPEAIIQAKSSGAELELPAALGVNRDEVIKTQDGGVLIRTSLWNGRIVDGKLTGKFSGDENGTFSMKCQSFLPSPTLNTNPPTDADRLYDGNGLALWDSYPHSGQEMQWKETEDRMLEVNSSYEGKKRRQDIRTRKEYSDYKLHLEFMLAYIPDAKGQGRSNSGIFHMGRYETQILDSFGLYGRDNECGGVYKIRVPDSNAVYPLGFWQTYDVDFTSHKNEIVDSDTLLYQVPGGMLSNFRNQLKEQGMEDKFEAVFAEIPVVREALGWIPLVTPTSQIVGVQSMLNVKFGRWKNFSPQGMDIALGYYGNTPAPVDPEVQALAAKQAGKEPITCRPADLQEPAMDKLRAELVAAELPSDDEHCVIHAMFPRQLADLYKRKNAPEEATPAQPEAPATAPVAVSSPAGNPAATVRNMALTIDGKSHHVLVEEL